MSSSPPPETDVTSDFSCQCKDEYQSACKGQPFFKEHDGKRYCVLHYPVRGKSDLFREALRLKYWSGDFNFRGVWFPDDLELRRITFETKVDCTGAVFNGEMVLSRNVFNEGADFSYAEFVKDLYFSYAEFFKDAVFDNTRFRCLAYFRRAKFRSSPGFESVAKFESATFGGEADFSVTNFEGAANFGYTTCMSYLKFSADDTSLGFTEQASLDFQFANVEKPERVSFNRLSLKPHWFIDVDSRKFDFVNVTWIKKPVSEVLLMLKGKESSTSPAAASTQRNSPSTPHRRLALAYRQLAVNAEENHRYREASDFRYRAMDTRRREKSHGYAFWTLDWLYWLASGYGERIIRASLILLVIWLTFALLYTRVGFARWQPKATNEQEAATARDDELGNPLLLPRSLRYSLGVVTLQKPEPPPATPAAEVLVTLETILGPLQAALLALAIRRKFMR